LDAVFDINEDHARRTRTTKGRLIVTVVSTIAEGALVCSTRRVDIAEAKPVWGLN
jgi:hypothetical protein